MFAVIRHPEAGIGTAPRDALTLMRANGWIRISEFRDEPGAFHLPDFADVTADLDAEAAPEVVAEPDPEPTPETKPAKTSSKEKPE